MNEHGHGKKAARKQRMIFSECLSVLFVLPLLEVSRRKPLDVHWLLSPEILKTLVLEPRKEDSALSSEISVTAAMTQKDSGPVRCVFRVSRYQRW